MKHMNRLTSAFRHRDNNAWGIKEKSGGSPPKIQQTTEDRSGVWSDASKGKQINNHAAVGRLSDTT